MGQFMLPRLSIATTLFMKNNILIFCAIFLAAITACKNKSAQPSDNQDIPGQVTQPGSVNPQSVAGKLEQATEAAATDPNALVWAGDVDPVCGMKIDRSAEDTVHYQGKIFGFCSESCKESFQENPKKWAEKK